MAQTWWPSSVKQALDGLSFTAETQPQTQRLAAQEAQANLQSAGWQPMPEMQAAPAPSAPPAPLPEIELPSLEEVTSKWREQPVAQQQPPPTPSGTPAAMPQAPGLVPATITTGPKPWQTLQPGESVGSVTMAGGSNPQKQAEVYQEARAAGLDDEAARILVAVTETEGGLTGAIGDEGKSRGPFQFHEGGQMPGFRAWVRQQGIQGDPDQLVHDHRLATRYAATTYLGRAIAAGRAQGLSGADLATYVQANGQVSVDPWKTGQNYQRLYGGGQPQQSAPPPSQPAAPPAQVTQAQPAQQRAPEPSRDPDDLVEVMSPGGTVLKVPRFMFGEGPGKYAPSQGWRLVNDARQSLNAGAAAASPQPAPAAASAPPSGGTSTPDGGLWSPDSPAEPQGAYQAATGRSGGTGVMLRGPLSSAPAEVGNDEPYDPRQYDEGPREAAPTSTYNDPTTTGTISEPIPQPQYDYQIADGRTEPPTPGGVWEPVRTIPNPQRPPAADPATFLAEDSQSTPPPPMADYPLTPPGSPYGDQQAAMEPATDRFAASEPTETQSTLKPVWDAAGNVLGYVQERGGRLAARVLDPQPMQGRTEADQRIIESTRSIRQPIESAVQPAARAIETTIGGPNAPEGSLLQAAQDASGVLGPEGPVRAFGSAVQSARSARVPDVETGLRGVMQPPNTSGAAGVVDDVLESQRPRALPAPAQRMALPEPVPTTSFEDFTRAADSPAQQAAREAASQPYIRPDDNQLLREQFGRPWEEVAPVYPGSANRLGEATQQIVTEGRRIRGPQEQVLPGERSMISPPRTIEPQSISLNSGLAPGPSDLRNAAQGGVVGAASEMTSDEELTPQERLVRIGTGAVLGVAAGRVARGSGQQLGSGFVSSPNYRPPTPAQVQAAQKAGPRRGAMLNQSVTAPSSDVPIRVRAVTAATDDRAGLRWAEDMLSDAAFSPRMRENDPLRPSTQSRVNAGSIANERIQNDLEPAIVNAGRAGLKDELPQYLEDVHQRDILDEFYNRGHAEELAAQQQRIAAAQARGASPATIQRMQQMSQQRAHAAGEQAMRRRQGGNADMTYEAIEARLQAQEARLTADGRWQPLQDAADAVWRHNDDTRQRLFDAGEVDQEWLDYMRQAYPHYVPTVPISHLDNRAGGPMVSNTGTRVSRGSQKSVQALDDVGTRGERLNPIVATRNATVRAERQIQRNRVAQAFAQMMDDALQASPGTMAAGRDHRTFLGGGVDVTYMAGGKPITMSVPKVVADGLEAAANMSADPGTVGRIWKSAMGFVTSAMTAGRASFLPVNLLRDLQDYALRTTANEGGPQALTGVLGTWLKQAGNAAADIAVAQVNPRGFAGAASGAITGAAVGDEDTTVAERLRNAAAGALTGTFLVGANKVKATGASREFLARGGGSGGLSANWRAGQRWYRDVLNDGGAPVRTPQDAARYLGDWLQDIATLQGVKGINERTELISRTAAMLRADAQKLPATEAMIRGRDASIDFDRAGTVARTINGIVPFFNATVQGGAQFARLFKQNPAAAAATVTATVAPVLLMTEAWNRSDPTRAQVYDDVPQYIKDTGVVVVLPWAGSDTRGERPNYLWIPTGATTPFVIGMRRAMEGLPGLEPTSGPVGDRPEASAVERWGNTLANVVQVFSPLRGDSASSLASNVVPQGVKQVLELGINKDLYRGNPIVTDNADERASAASRGVASAANAAGRAVGSDFLQNVRPSGVEHLVNALPAYGDIVKGASDLVAPSGFKQAEDRPIQNAPFVGGVAQRFIRDTGGANLQRAQDAALSDSVRDVLMDAGMRPGDLNLSVPASYKSAPLTRDEQLSWQEMTNSLLDRRIMQVTRSGEWRTRGANHEQLIRDAVAAAKADAAARALRRLTDREIERRIQEQQSMKAS